MLVSNIKSDFTFKTFENFVIRKHMDSTSVQLEKGIKSPGNFRNLQKIFTLILVIQ